MKKNTQFTGHIQAVALALVALLGLKGCASLDEAFGLAKNAPDASQVITHKPLENPQVATLPEPGKGVDTTIVPDPVDLEANIRAQLEEEKKRGNMPEGASPETRSALEAYQKEAEENQGESSRHVAAQEKSDDGEGSKEKPWWKIW